jgi:endo-1,4-beta-mannosidase
MQWPYEWDFQAVEIDFKNIQKLHINLVRFDLLWGWFEPRPGQYNESAFKQLDQLISLAHRYNVYLMPTLLIGNEVGDAFWDVAWRNGRHPHSDPEMLRLQVHHAEEFAKRYSEEPAILAWDLTDEPPFWIVADTTSDSMASNWTQLLCDGIRKYDPHHLIICGTLGQETTRGPFRADIISPWVNAFCVHPYPIYDPGLYQEPLLSTRLTYSPEFEILLSRGAGRPVLMQEFGASSSQFHTDVIGHYYNTIMYSALAAGVQGYVAWCYTDADPKIYDRAPFKRWPHETQFGVVESSGKEKSAAVELNKFSDLLQHIDLDQVELPSIEAGLIVPHEWSHGPDYAQYGLSENQSYQYTPRDILLQEKDKIGNLQLMQSWLSSFILCRQAGLLAGFPRELDDWTGIKLLLAPVPATTSTNPAFHLYTTFWRKAKLAVEAGSVLYASLSCNSAIPNHDMQSLFGATIFDRSPWKPQIQIRFLEDFYGLKKGQELNINSTPGLQGMGVVLDVKDAHVLAVDQDNHPALLMKAVGHGHSVLCAYPIEYSLGNTPNAFENSGNCWQIYHALKSLAEIRSPYYVDNPAVEVGWLCGTESDYVVLVNHSPNEQKGYVTASLPGKAVQILPEGDRSLAVANTSWPYYLPGFTGCLYANEKKAYMENYTSAGGG